MSSNDYSKMCDSKNLARAYRWTQSNPNPEYKNYFRDAYEAYAASSRQNLKRLRKHLEQPRNAYEPSHASKVFLPKSSGILRPYTLLTVNDQIVYQACINIIAEKLFPKVRQNYLNKTFGNLYAGKTSKFFYRKWQDGYGSFSEHIRYYINNGFKYVANFDLTSFYDSIDHAVLKYFLSELQIDYELTEFLLKCLKVWTSSTWDNSSNAIYHGHGIPQGPLASGLLSELVLKYIDDIYNKKSKIKYIRYVDDIKLFAKSENILRCELVKLDLSAKKIGLFPQSLKINIRKVNDPSEEIKSISLPHGIELLPSKANQKKLQKKLLELIKNKRVKSENITIFKRIIGQVVPTYSLNIRLINLLHYQPEFFSQIALYFSKYRKLPKKSAELLINYIKENEIYHTVHGRILFATIKNMHGDEKTKCADHCYKRLMYNNKSSMSQLQPIYKAALIAWCLENKKLNYSEFNKILNDEMNWWVKKDILKYINKDIYGNASYAELLNNIINGRDEEYARIAAYKIVSDNINLDRSYKNAQEAARLLLFSAGKIRNIGRPRSIVGLTLDYILGYKNNNFSNFNWHKFFNTKHSDAQIIAIEIKASKESNINDCIVKLDSLCDLIWESVFVKELPQKQYGNYGSMLKNIKLISKYNIAAQGFLNLHNLRLESITAHPRNSKTNLPTRILKYHDFNRIRSDVYNAINEIVSKVAI